MTKKKPLIALTPYFNIERDEPYMRPAYLKAIRAAGGIPMILPLDLEEEDLQQIVDTFDGFFLTIIDMQVLCFKSELLLWEGDNMTLVPIVFCHDNSFKRMLISYGGMLPNDVHQS